eukprot:Gb_05981 [translate_table: standard]
MNESILNKFYRMQCLEKLTKQWDDYKPSTDRGQKCVLPSHFTFASVLSVCANLAALERGKEVREGLIRTGLESDLIVGNVLVDMYAKCGCIENARHVFDKMAERNVVPWTAMIAGYARDGRHAQNGRVDETLKLFQKMPCAGYAQNGHFDEDLKLFRQMQLAGVKPNSETFACTLPACANLAVLEQGKEVHEDIIKSGIQSDLFVGSALVDMYAKCGTWRLSNSEQMQHSSMNPYSVTFIGVLSAWCNAGLVDDGQQYFNCMYQYYHITPAMEHYSCMAEFLGHAGLLDEAHDFINKMTIKPNADVWGSLLSVVGFITIYS